MAGKVHFETKVGKVCCDESPENADWTKQSWDLPAFATTDELRKFLAESGITVEHFKTLPVYQLNKDRMAILRDL